jgi:hypothetical protein
MNFDEVLDYENFRILRRHSKLHVEQFLEFSLLQILRYILWKLAIFYNL